MKNYHLLVFLFIAIIMALNSYTIGKFIEKNSVLKYVIIICIFGTLVYTHYLL